MYFFTASSSWLEDLTDWIGMIKIVVALFFGSGVLFVCVFCVVCVRAWTVRGRRWWMGFFFQGIWAASSGAGKRVSERAGKYWTRVTVLVLLLSILVSSWFNPCLKCVALRGGTDRSLCGSASYFSSSLCGQWRQDSSVSGAAVESHEIQLLLTYFSVLIYLIHKNACFLFTIVIWISPWGSERCFWKMFTDNFIEVWSSRALTRPKLRGEVVERALHEHADVVQPPSLWWSFGRRSDSSGTGWWPSAV